MLGYGLQLHGSSCVCSSATVSTQPERLRHRHSAATVSQPGSWQSGHCRQATSSSKPVARKHSRTAQLLQPQHACRVVCSAASSSRSTDPALPEAPAIALLPEVSSATKKSVVIVGGGWAGFGAAKHLSQQGFDVTLLDASPNPGGLSAGWRTKQGRAVEAGVKGFWYQYHNIFSLVRELGIDWPFTPFTTSGFWTPEGLLTEAPVMSQLPQLPTLIGQFVHTAPLFRNLSLADRATMLPLLYSFLDYDSSPETYARYDQMSARDLFAQYRISNRLYEAFLKPLLLVGLFAPPEEISAGAMLGTLYFYALAHQNDFDVCWCRGSVSERIFTPLVDRIAADGGQVVGGRLVTRIVVEPLTGTATGVHAKDREGQEAFYPADAVIFAVGITGMQKLVTASPALAARREFRALMNLKAIDVIATRLWLDRIVPTRFPANVLSGFEEDAGGTWFNLNELQDEYRTAEGSVIAADFYSASSMLPLSNEQIVARVHENLIRCEPGFRGTTVVDSKVLRFQKAVTHFSTGSYASRPTQRTSFGNVFMAGDWVKELKHGSNGLSQERAYVSGLAAANLVIDKLQLGAKATILDVEADEPHIALGKQAVRTVRSTLDQLGIRSPFV